MGRTVLPYSHVLEKEKESWKLFRKAMSKEDQEAFDRLFDRAKFHTHPPQCTRPIPFPWKPSYCPSAWNTRR